MKLTLDALKSVVASYVDSNKISLETFVETRANSVGLLDTIAKIFTIESRYVDKLDVFDGEDLSYGKTIEEWQADLILPESYDATGAGALAPHDSTYRPVSFSYTLGRVKIPQTIRNNDVERAVHNAEQFGEIIASKTKAMYDSERVFRYDVKKQGLGEIAERCVYAQDASNADVTIASMATAVGQAMAVNELLAINGENYIVEKPITTTTLTGQQLLDGGYIVKLDLVETLAKPVDTATGEAFVESIKKAVEIASGNSEGRSLNGNTLGAVDGLVLVVKYGIMPNIEVQTQAGAFQADKVALPTKIIRIDSFGSLSANAEDVYAILLDVRGMRLHNSYRAVRENMNGDGDFLNLFFHTENTLHISKNTFVRVYTA